MRVCGVELKGSEAVISLLNYDRGAFSVPECRQRVFAVSQSAQTDAIRQFQFAFGKLMEDYQVDAVAIIAREQKGKHAGSATSFKLEAAIQLLELPVALVTSSEIKAQLKQNPLQAEFESLGLKKFQQPAFNAAYAYQHQQL